MPTNKKQQRVREFNLEVQGVYTQWLESLDHKSATAEALSLYKELPEVRRTAIAQEIIDIVSMKRMQQDTEVEVINIDDEQSDK